jgi:hypothetical protein
MPPLFLFVTIELEGKSLLKHLKPNQATARRLSLFIWVYTIKTVLPSSQKCSKQKTLPEAEFWNEIQTKVLLAIHSRIYSFAIRLTHATSYIFLISVTMRCKEK